MPKPTSLQFKISITRSKIRWFPYRIKKKIRILLRKLNLMKPYVPLDAYSRPYSLEDVLSCTGRGWENLLRECYAICVATETDIHQVKEKFGGLRFYVGGSSSKALDNIETICSRSYSTCENCGKPGTPTTGGWIKTLCPDCTQVTNKAPSRELDHLLSPKALKSWNEDVRSGKVHRTLTKFINALKED